MAPNLLKNEEVKEVLEKLLVQEHHGHFQPILVGSQWGFTIVCYIDGAWKEQDVFTGHG